MEEHKKNALKARLKTAGVLAAVAAGFLLFAGLSCIGHFALIMLGLFFVGAAAWEFASFSEGHGGLVRRFFHFILTVSVPLLTTLVIMTHGFCEPSSVIEHGHYIAGQGFFICFAFSLLYMLLSGRNDISLASKAAADILPAVFLIGFCGSLLILLAAYSDAPRLILWLLIVVCVNDSAAYFAGSKYGGPKLAPALSPNKTIIGSAAGFGAGVIGGVISSGLIYDMALADAWLVSAGCVAAAQMGDLLKSYLKRLHNVKDSGSILPGHGGVLDRIDGILMASPVILTWIITARTILR